DHRIPIAGVAARLLSHGGIEIVAEGVNGRIPTEPNQRGYPTDHGETAAIRSLDHGRDIDWSEVVFATTLSPCAMCARTLVELSRLGLKRFVIAESESFPGRRDLLEAIEGSMVVCLRERRAIRLMETFANRYPWDWAADIGEIPPERSCPAETLREVSQSLLDRHDRTGALVTYVIGPDGKPIMNAEDTREQHFGNPTYSAPIRAIGLAGSHVNLRECSLLCFRTNGQPVRRSDFGEASIGACEVFRPAQIVFAVTPERSLLESLRQTGAEIMVVPSDRLE
ncbi:MAG: hypothetical protein AAGJ83_05870, partial [Planctomycetota bacterium]